jgi:hypothetical protein
MFSVLTAVACVFLAIQVLLIGLVSFGGVITYSLDDRKWDKHVWWDAAQYFRAYKGDFQFMWPTQSKPTFDDVIRQSDEKSEWGVLYYRKQMQILRMMSMGNTWDVKKTTVTVGVPFWLLFIPFVPYPAIVFIRGPYRRYRRRKKGLCLKCGYNLTGNVSEICPECGEKI